MEDDSKKVEEQEAPKAMAKPFQKKGVVAPVVEAKVVEIVKPKRFIVKRDKVISWYGSMTTMAKGSVVDAASYGEHGMQRIRDQGVELEEIQD